MNEEAPLSAHLLRADEVAQLLQIGRSTVYMLCQQGQLPHIVINRSIRIPAYALARWIERNTTLPDDTMMEAITHRAVGEAVSRIPLDGKKRTS